MKNLPFVLWMLGWPLILDLGSYLTSFYKVVTEPESATMMLWLIIYIAIAYLLYEKKE